MGTMLTFASCVDTVIIPDDKTVDEDFWQTKSDVSQMVNSAYYSMLDHDLMFRLLTWSEFRSDDVVRSPGLSSNSTTEALDQIQAQHIETDNTFANWDRLYTVINNCNIVLERAPEVVMIDPDYTESDFLADQSQMLALRSLCYFYLVRTFRDVPMPLTAYMNSSQEMSIPQEAPATVINQCIADLEKASLRALSPSSYRASSKYMSGTREWRHCGWLNKAGIQAILADIYLWRASVMHSAADYQKCIDYCDSIVEIKKELYSRDVLKLFNEDTGLPLDGYREAFEDIFVNQNSMESIFELQYDGANNSNSALCQLYHKYANNSSASGYFQASSIFGNVGSPVWNGVKSDHRFQENVYSAGKDLTSFDIRKMIDQGSTSYNNDPTDVVGGARISRTYDNFRQNFIVYRLSDVLLMKAEALVQLASDNSDTRLQDACKIVWAINSRSIYPTAASVANDTIKFTNYNTKERMEDLVLQERQRELCFEGKRWYDLMRYNYRKINAADYTKTFGELLNENGGTYTFPANDAAMLALVTRGLLSGQASVVARMRYENSLYMPIYRKEVKVNNLLVQNPAYSDVDEFERTN